MNIAKIPIGNTKNDIKIRENIISQVYKDFYFYNPNKAVYNRSLKAYINVRYLSITETIRHAAKSYLSTLAVMQLETVMNCAKYAGEHNKPKKGIANQAQFSEMRILYLEMPGIGTIKLTVGIKKTSGDYIQYCLTAVNTKIEQ